MVNMDSHLNEKSCCIEEEFVRVQGVKTAVLKLGHLKEKDAGGSPRTLMLIIPGNPGVPYYYEDFMQELYSHCGGQIPVWAIGQAGHIIPPGEHLSISNVVSTNDNLYGLEAQISHKLAFIQENIPADVSLILIGHSIGCYMILNILDGLASRDIARCFMLFPTIERMAVTPNGRKLTPLLRYFRWISVLLAFFFCFLPQTVRTELLKWVYRKVDYPECVPKALLKTVTPWSANFSTYLAKTEMNKVTTLQRDLVEKHLSKLSLYYGTIDDWAPVQYYRDFMEQFPQADARLCDLRLKHAFILKKSEGQAMAKIIWQWALSHNTVTDMKSSLS
ncbi:hypothetical protein EGW08_006429 [Elysia chlorotica]|uniref:Lipid droplet-associated hydrolase n=1 Tax=Elysia chlorotica TaxID=188477 RepID=A0A3S1BDG1_ELYCH|nr:hypothetical protein EGW08_006429 [Elysia chlorotica]